MTSAAEMPAATLAQADFHPRLPLRGLLLGYAYLTPEKRVGAMRAGAQRCQAMLAKTLIVIDTRENVIGRG